MTLDADIESTISVMADRRAVKQIFVNLLSNAVKFTPDDGRVTVRSHVLPNSIVLMIADTGIGIAPASLRRLGNPFEQVESQLTKTYQGSGLGLGHRALADQPAWRNDAAALEARHRHRGAHHAAARRRVQSRQRVRSPPDFPAHAPFFDRLVATSTSMNETAVISVLMAAIVGSISSRSAVNIRLVSG